MKTDIYNFGLYEKKNLTTLPQLCNIYEYNVMIKILTDYLDSLED